MWYYCRAGHIKIKEQEIDRCTYALAYMDPCILSKYKSFSINDVGAMRHLHGKNGIGHHARHRITGCMQDLKGKYKQ